MPYPKPLKKMREHLTKCLGLIEEDLTFGHLTQRKREQLEGLVKELRELLKEPSNVK